MFESLLKKVRMAALVPVVQTEEVETALHLVDALDAGGVKAIEMTFRTKNGEVGLRKIAACITAVRKEKPDFLIGAGTVTNETFASIAVESGAQFIVSPGYNEKTVDWCLAHEVPVIPGVNCASQIELAVGKGLSAVKFFPAELSGGVKMIKALSGPFPTLSFMPTGGINADNIGDYMKLPNVLAVGGSWFVKNTLYEDGSFERVTEETHRAIVRALGLRFGHVGINFNGEADGRSAASQLALFGFEGNENPASIFCGSEFELMKGNGRGTNGHIGILTYNVERALDYLSRFGYLPVAKTAKHETDDPDSPLTFVYLDKDIGGFGIHLKKSL